MAGDRKRRCVVGCRGACRLAAVWVSHLNGLRSQHAGHTQRCTSMHTLNSLFFGLHCDTPYLMAAVRYRNVGNGVINRTCTRRHHPQDSGASAPVLRTETDSIPEHRTRAESALKAAQCFLNLPKAAGMLPRPERLPKRACF